MSVLHGAGVTAGARCPAKVCLSVPRAGHWFSAFHSVAKRATNHNTHHNRLRVISTAQAETRTPTSTGASAASTSHRRGTSDDLSIPTSYRKLIASGCGETFRDVAQVINLTSRPVLADEVLVRVEYAGVNGGCETFRVRGDHAFAYLKGRDGFDLGAEGCGVVLAIGSNVKDVRVGDHVTFAGGAFAELAYLPSKSVFKIRQCCPEAVALSLSAVTACVGIHVTGKCQPNMTVLVTAAAGGTGHFAAQLALRAGARVIATCGSKRKADRLRALGVHRVINHREEDVSRVLREEFPGGIDLAYEGVGGVMLSAAVENLAPGGLVMVVGYISRYPHAMGEELTKKAPKPAPPPPTGPEGAAPSASRRGQTRGGRFLKGICVQGWELPTEEEIFWGRMQLDDGKGRRVMGDVFHCPAEERKGCKERVFEMFYRGELEAWVDERDFAGVEEVPDAIGERDGVDDDGGVEVPDAIGERDGDDDVGGEEVPDFVGKRSYYDCDDDIEVH